MRKVISSSVSLVFIALFFFISPFDIEGEYPFSFFFFLGVLFLIMRLFYEAKRNKLSRAAAKNALESSSVTPQKTVAAPDEPETNILSSSGNDPELNITPELLNEKQQEYNDLISKIEASQKTLNQNASKTQKLQTIYKSLQNAIKAQNEYPGNNTHPIDTSLLNETDDLLSSTVELRLNYMSIKQLRTLFNQNKKIISEVLEKYKSRYTTKANMAIYNLMVLALEAELQNVLYNIKYSKLDSAVNDIKTITAKYLKIASDGNQSIAPTVTKFIGEIEYLYIEAVKIEYEYYVQKERAKEEQRATREQMRQEAEERKQLELERKKVEKEEEKFKNELAQISERMANLTDNEELKVMEERINQLSEQLEAVETKKETISKLQLGKAGYVYVISNRGSFGSDVFKIGMTRRDKVEERVDELSNASVPFPFYIHSKIFSDDAVALEKAVHQSLHKNRLNKVNLRKEFFKVTLEELEELVYSFQPTAEFSRTLLAEQYDQSLSLGNDIPENLLVEDEEYEDDIDIA